MVEEPAQLVRRAYDAWNRDGTEQLEQYLAEDVVLHDWDELADAAVWRGRGVVIARLEEVGSRVGGGWVEFGDVAETDEGVRVEMEWKLEGGGEGGVSLGRVCHVVGLDRDGKIASIRVLLGDR